MLNKNIIVRMAQNYSIYYPSSNTDVTFKKGNFYACEQVNFLSAQLIGYDNKVYFIPLEMIENGMKLYCRFHNYKGV